MLFLPCLFHTMTGWYCPGCGGTRAFRYLLRGEWFQSFRYHPLILYTALVMTLEIVTFLAAKTSGRNYLYLGHEKLFLYMAVGSVTVNFLVKNYLLIWCGVDLLALP